MASYVASRLALVAALAAGALAQRVPEVHATFGARSARLTLPAIEWLCTSHLPARAEWPADLDPNGPFAVVLSDRGLRILPTRVTLPRDVACGGSCTFDGGAPLLWSCGSDGVEDWFVPRAVNAPAAWRTLLAGLEVDSLAWPRTLDTAVVVAHLAGATVDGDPRGELLRLGSALCGQVSFTAWSSNDHLRVRGRSDGGLALPALLLALAAESKSGAETALALRAFAARDSDRAEATRQFARVPGDRSVDTLRALLHADDAVALVAIDALVRLRAAGELPNIVAAASPDAPWASLAAADALRELWPDAAPAVRARTRTAAAACRATSVREVDLDRLPTRIARPAAETQAAPDGSGRAQALLLMGLFAIGLHGLWARERARLRRATASR